VTKSKNDAYNCNESKEREKIKTKNKKESGSTFKKVSKKDFEVIKLDPVSKSPCLNKISSACSIQKYYILNKNIANQKTASK
jgi:hypothetical protein